jgi:hypothetical protein
MPVSVNVWLTELWYSHIDVSSDECEIDFHKDIGATDPHITGGDSEDKTLVVCADTDSDGVADFCTTNGEDDNCDDVANPGQENADGDSLGDACDPTPSHDVEVKYCLKFGPAPINLTDSLGAYLWVICEIGNNSNHDEVVTIAHSVNVTLPAGCTKSATADELIVPGQNTFLLLGPDPVDDDGDTVADEDPIDGLDNDGDTEADEDPPEAGEQKFVVIRSRFECHAPATTQTLQATINVSISINEPGDTPPGDGPDTNPANNSAQETQNIIVGPPAPP